MNIVLTLTMKEEDLVDVPDQHEDRMHLMKQTIHYRILLKMNPCKQHEYVIYTHTISINTNKVNSLKI